jgi:hypothetical protein
MPQTSTALNTTNAVVEVSTNGTSWTNISGTSNMVEPTPQTVDTGSAATLEGKYKIVLSGKYNPQEVTVTILYTETASEAYAILYGQREIGTIYFRYTPGGSNGEYRYKAANSSGQTTAARIVEFPLPPVNAGEASPTMVTFKLQCDQLVREAATPSPSASVSPSASASA